MAMFLVASTTRFDPVFDRTHSSPSASVSTCFSTPSGQAGIEAALKSYRQGRVVDARRVREIIDGALRR